MDNIITLQQQAQAALIRSDKTVMRCVEAGQAIPAAWTSYRAALRAIASGGSGPLPARPAWPSGT